MYIPDKLKCNRFVAVNIPDNKSYFARFGNKVVPDNFYSGDDPAPSGQRKMDTLAYMDDYDRMMQEEESKKNE